jgi:hypothetical protein
MPFKMIDTVNIVQNDFSMEEVQNNNSLGFCDAVRVA